MNCPNCKITVLTKTLDGHSYEITPAEEEFAKTLSAYPTSPDTMRMKASMFELKCDQCSTTYTFCISCKRFVKHDDLQRITKPKWESFGGSLTQLEGVFVEYMRCPFCGFSVGGVRERTLTQNDAENEWL
jgi:hypothetical protein